MGIWTAHDPKTGKTWTYRDGENGWFCFLTLGGPFDGGKYKWSRVTPDDIPVAVFIPLRPGGGGDAKAKYVRVGDELRDPNGVRYHEFIFDGFVGPNLEALIDATAAIECFVDLSARHDVARLATED